MLKPLTLPPIHPNQGLQAAYRRKLDKLIDEMHKSLTYWITAAYKANTPEIAMDASPAKVMRQLIRKLRRRWDKKFNQASLDLANYFSTAVADRVDGALSTYLTDAGFSVDFKYTAAMNDVIQATIGEQVGLIRSIPAQHFSEIEGLVMRSVATGRDIKYLSDELQKRYGVTKRRAQFIARDQINKATANIVRVRQKSMGCTHARWLHSHGGKKPRESHLEASNNKLVYNIDKGAWLEGNGGKWDWIFPGEAINCRCVSVPVIPLGMPSG